MLLPLAESIRGSGEAREIFIGSVRLAKSIVLA
jgi:hypothetical protein